MSIEITKLIQDVAPYFKYENEANATTQDQFQAFLKNLHAVVNIAIKDIWQPETTYAEGEIIASPNMPKGYKAKCIIGGTSGVNEPEWGTSINEVADGTARWYVSYNFTTFNGTQVNDDNNYVVNIVEAIYPVGSLYWNKDKVDPSSLFPNTTWERVTDKFILAAGDSYSAGATGGSATVTLTTAQLPAHSHTGSSSTIGNHAHLYYSYRDGGDYGGFGGYGDRNQGYSTSSAGSHSHSISISNTGSNQPHNNLPPYIVYYCWVRVS